MTYMTLSRPWSSWSLLEASYENTYYQRYWPEKWSYSPPTSTMVCETPPVTCNFAFEGLTINCYQWRKRGFSTKDVNFLTADVALFDLVQEVAAFFLVYDRIFFWVWRHALWWWAKVWDEIRSKWMWDRAYFPCCLVSGFGYAKKDLLKNCYWAYLKIEFD